MKPLDNEEIQAFMLVVEKRSITAVAYQMNLSKSVISKRVSDLERNLGAQLLVRSTRGVMPTEAGLLFYEAATESMRRLNAAVEAISERKNNLFGKLRVVAPVSFTQLWLGRVVAEFAQTHPDLNVVLDLDDRIVNIEAERFDVAIRVARLPDSAMPTKHLGVSSRVLVCSPEYMKRHGSPKTLDDILRHRCLCYSDAPVSRTWSFRPASPDGKPRTLSPASMFASNNGETLRDAAVAGVGLALLPNFVVARDLAEHRLVKVLPQERPEDDVIYAAYPRSPFTSHKLRTFIEYMRLWLIDTPWEGFDFADARQSGGAAPVECAPVR